MKWAGHISLPVIMEQQLTHFSQIREMRLLLFQIGQELDRKCNTSFVHQDLLFSFFSFFNFIGHYWARFRCVNEKWIAVGKDE